MRFMAKFVFMAVFLFSGFSALADLDTLQDLSNRIGDRLARVDDSRLSQNDMDDIEDHLRQALRILRKADDTTPQPPAPRPTPHLCSSTYFGSYENGESVQFQLRLTHGNEIEITRTFRGYTSMGTGTCETRYGSVHVTMVFERSPQHTASIDENGNMIGNQDRGFRFTATRQ